MQAGVDAAWPQREGGEALCGAVAARVREAGRHMLLVQRLEGCFGEAVEALERSLWGGVGGML